MTIEKLISLAEEFYSNDEKANKKNSPLWLLKTHAKIAQEYFQSHPEFVRNNITEIELLSVIMLEGFASRFIQKSAFNSRQPDKISKILIDALDSILLKTNKNSEKILYRNEKSSRKEYKIGQKIKIPGFFTTSKDDFDNASSVKWIITPLSSKKTKAHEIYRIYNHGSKCPYPEYQIEFERGTTFIVTAIEKGDRFDTIHITETES